MNPEFTLLTPLHLKVFHQAFVRHISLHGLDDEKAVRDHRFGNVGVVVLQQVVFQDQQEEVDDIGNQPAPFATLTWLQTAGLLEGQLELLRLVRVDYPD